MVTPNSGRNPFDAGTTALNRHSFNGDASTLRATHHHAEEHQGGYDHDDDDGNDEQTPGQVHHRIGLGAVTGHVGQWRRGVGR